VEHPRFNPAKAFRISPLGPEKYPLKQNCSAKNIYPGELITAGNGWNPFYKANCLGKRFNWAQGNNPETPGETWGKSHPKKGQFIKDF